jgi:hypothetical protein
MKKTPLAVLTFGLFLAAALAFPSPGRAQVPTPGQASAGPSSRLKFSFTERIRQESWDNAISLAESEADSLSQIRFRTSLALLWTPSPRWEATLRLTNENRYYLAPKNRPYNIHEAFFEELHVRWKEAFGLPLALCVGRQNLMLGEGFVIFDGGPLDGSRSAYFNAIRADIRLAKDQTLMVFALKQPRTDTYLPLINDRNQLLVEQPESGYGLYWTWTARDGGLETYLFRKNTGAVAELPAGVPAEITVAGGRLKAPVLAKGWTLTAEGAYEFGRRGDQDVAAFGGYAYLTAGFSLVPEVPSSLSVGVIHLGGDNLATADRSEAWDPAFSRWPKWSESLIYTSIRENGGKPAYWTNMGSLFGTAEIGMSKSFRLVLTIHRLTAPRQSAATSFLSGAGRRRGDLAIARLVYNAGPHLAGHIVWEYFRPGNYFRAGASDYAWLRFELFFKF